MKKTIQKIIKNMKKIGYKGVIFHSFSLFLLQRKPTHFLGKIVLLFRVLLPDELSLKNALMTIVKQRHQRTKENTVENEWNSSERCFFL